MFRRIFTTVYTFTTVCRSVLLQVRFVKNLDPFVHLVIVDVWMGVQDLGDPLRFPRPGVEGSMDSAVLASVGGLAREEELWAEGTFHREGEVFRGQSQTVALRSSVAERGKGKAIIKRLCLSDRHCLITMD